MPAEEIAPDPRGYRVHVVDYDSSVGTFYMPIKYPTLTAKGDGDPFADAYDSQLLNGATEEW